MLAALRAKARRARPAGAARRRMDVRALGLRAGLRPRAVPVLARHVHDRRSGRAALLREARRVLRAGRRGGRRRVRAAGRDGRAATSREDYRAPVARRRNAACDRSASPRWRRGCNRIERRYDALDGRRRAARARRDARGTIRTFTPSEVLRAPRRRGLCACARPGGTTARATRARTMRDSSRGGGAS